MDLKIIFYTVKILFLPESTEGVSADQDTAMAVNYIDNEDVGKISRNDR